MLPPTRPPSSTAIAAALAALAACLAAALAPRAGAIVAGQPVPRAAYPFFATVGAGCGGALVAPRRVLTAAHCREAVAEKEHVWVGPRRARRAVRRLAILPLHVRELARMEREFPPPAGDLMLLELERPVPGARPVPIATPAERLDAPGTLATAIGAGATGTHGRGAGTLRRGTVEVRPPASCREQLGTALLRRWSLCTRDPRMAEPGAAGPFVSACFGDSGSPLLVGAPGAERLVGVVSWGPSCGERRDPEIYADAVAGRAFALDPAPAWAPRALPGHRVVGVPRVGAVVTCRVRWLVRPTRGLAYSFVVGGRQAASGPRPTYRVRAADAGKPIRCEASGATAGGRGGTARLSPPRRVLPR